MVTFDDYQSGNISPEHALRALCSDLGEVEDTLAPLLAERDALRAQISEVLLKVDGEKAEIAGFGTVRLTPPSVTAKYETKLTDALVDELLRGGYSEIAEQLARCKTRSQRAGGLRVEREKAPRGV